MQRPPRWGEVLVADPAWSSVGFAYIGCSADGLDLRVRYFHGAELKMPR